MVFLAANNCKFNDLIFDLMQHVATTHTVRGLVMFSVLYLTKLGFQWWHFM